MGERLNLEDLNLAGPGRRVNKPLTAHVVRELGPADLQELTTERNTSPAPLKRLRERHHGLAKALVDGVSEADAAAIYGYSSSRISILKADPTFQELMNFYREGKQERYLEMHDRLAGLGTDAIEELTARLEEEPDEISVGQLLEISKMSLDRAGFGPSTNTNVNVKVGLADKLEAARKRALQHRSDQLIESRAKDVTPPEDD